MPGAWLGQVSDLEKACPPTTQFASIWPHERLQGGQKQGADSVVGGDQTISGQQGEDYPLPALPIVNQSMVKKGLIVD